MRFISNISPEIDVWADAGRESDGIPIVANVLPEPSLITHATGLKSLMK